LHVVVGIGSLLLIAVVLADAFESVVLPRRVDHRLRFSRSVVRGLWEIWSRVAGVLAGRERPGAVFRATFLGSFGPFALLTLFATWAISLVVGFAGLHWAAQSQVAGDTGGGFGRVLYFSGTTFFTLGLGDLAPVTALGRVLTVVEAGTGFAFLALVIGYTPVFYQAFSAREASIALLDARAGSPPSAAELLRRLAAASRPVQYEAFLGEWERWSAQLLENTLSYPILAYYRSQHERQSWVAALTTVLDACALTLTGIQDVPTHQARLTFAMAQHTAVDLTQAIAVEPRPLPTDRLAPADLVRLRAALGAGGLRLSEGDEADRTLSGLRRLYEPHVHALAHFLGEALPPWIAPPGEVDDWLESEADRAAAQSDPVTATRLQRDVRFPARGATDGAEASMERVTPAEG
jgi:hypothetical protein